MSDATVFEMMDPVRYYAIMIPQIEVVVGARSYRFVAVTERVVRPDLRDVVTLAFEPYHTVFDAFARQHANNAKDAAPTGAHVCEKFDLIYVYVDLPDAIWRRRLFGAVACAILTELDSSDGASMACLAVTLASTALGHIWPEKISRTVDQTCWAPGKAIVGATTTAGGNK